MKSKIKLRITFDQSGMSDIWGIPNGYKVRKEIYHGIRLPISYPCVQVIVNSINRNLRDREDNEE